MPDIVHRVGIKTESPVTTYDALAGWWTEQVSGDGKHETFPHDAKIDNWN
ncbi:hypothetical protein [Devosia sediminis]|uniref:Uncharacterized protein n=1 Tax=Devosia sediminis TaxID=2798801 RepID=A0A934MKI1_9HYPH|nr:hypothetical protein [Devosia sediminis]MBJ3783586.1 hypothetical protein [Devosia sediminis]